MNCNYKSAILKDFKFFMRQAGKPVINPRAHSYSENNKQRNNTTMKKSLLLAVAALVATGAYAQGVKIKGVYENMRNNDGEINLISIGSIFEKDGVYTTNYMYGQPGWTFVNYLSLPPQGIYSMTYDGTTVSTPVKDPRYAKADIIDADNIVDMEKASIAINYNMMSGNSGAGYVDGKIVTVMSRDYQSTTDEELFAVRKWDAKTGKLLSGKEDYYNVSANLESAGISYNPKDGKIYGLFHFTDAPLNTAITDNPEYYTDEDDKDFDREGLDDGWAIGTIDPVTMEVTQITPGLYYGNYITFAINSEGRAFALTSGGSQGYEGADGRIYDINNNLSGASLCEFDLTTGLMMTVPVKTTQNVYDDGGNITGTEEVTEWVSKYLHGTGYASQARRQSACFAKSNPNIMYWNGYFNSGKGIGDGGSYTSLPDREWKTNGKYDTCLYAVDVTTGTGVRLGKITDRYIFSAIWVEGDDCSDGAGLDITGISEVKAAAKTAAKQGTYNLNGQRVGDDYRGIIVKDGVKMIKK